MRKRLAAIAAELSLWEILFPLNVAAWGVFVWVVRVLL